jgi:uncharacterized protein (TIGR00299 family) protein
MKTLYLDIFSGISGDMFIGAMLDLGVDFHALEHELEKLGLDEYHLHQRRDFKSAIEGVTFDVHLAHEHDHDHHHEHDHHHHHHEHEHHEHDHHDHDHDDHDDHHHDEEHEHEHGRGFAEIRELIDTSKLSSWVKEKSIAVFRRIAEAEGKIHGVPTEEVHFHEVGAVDSIVDIVGACIAVELLGKPRILASEVVEGRGFVECAHGSFPIPTPATLDILGAAKIAITQCEEPHELVTPTGAAILAEFVQEFGPMRGLVAQKIGFGLGTRNNKTRPNVLRAILGQTRESSVNDWETDTIITLETNLDDCLPEALGRLLERAIAEGALDVFYTPIQMKKNRPGVLLTVLCDQNSADRFSELILRESTAFGVRRSFLERRKLRREIISVKTKFGAVAVKVGRLNGKVVQSSPEFEACRRVADEKQVALMEVYREAQGAARALYD